MKTKSYRYERGHTIEVLGHRAEIGGIAAAAMCDGQVLFEGTLFQCVMALKNRGDEMAARHARLIMAASQSDAQPGVRRKNDKRSFLARKRFGQ
jgi:hypothetical protein